MVLIIRDDSKLKQECNVLKEHGEGLDHEFSSFIELLKELLPISPFALALKHLFFFLKSTTTIVYSPNNI